MRRFGGDWAWKYSYKGDGDGHQKRMISRYRGMHESKITLIYDIIAVSSAQCLSTPHLLTVFHFRSPHVARESVVTAIDSHIVSNMLYM